MKRFVIMLACLAVAFFAAAADLVVSVDAVKRQSVSLNEVAASGSGGQTFLRTLQNDLLRSGWYRIAPNGQVRVRGSVSGSDGTQENLTVSWAGKMFRWPRVSADTNEARRHAHELSDAILQQTMGEKGMAQSRFAMVCKSGVSRSGQAIEDLYICDYDGYNLTRLTNDGAPIVGPRWSPDNRFVYFTSYRLGFPAVFRADVKTRQVTQLANFRGLNTGAVPSPTDPNRLAIILSHQGNPELYIMDARTKELTRLTRTRLAAEASPAWSPDGRSICYVTDVTGSPQLYIVDVATKKSRRLTMRGGENVQPDWGKNGIVFATKRGCPYRIAVINPARGEASLRYLTPKNEQYESPSWAPDGRHVVAARTQGRVSSIEVLDADPNGAKPYKPFGAGRWQWLNPAWSR